MADVDIAEPYFISHPRSVEVSHAGRAGSSRIPSSLRRVADGYIVIRWIAPAGRTRWQAVHAGHERTLSLRAASAL